MKKITEPVPEGLPSFAGFPGCKDVEKLIADAAIIGIPYKSPYSVTDPEEGTVITAPDAIRRHSKRYAGRLNHYDFDFGGDIFAGHDLKIVDCGNVVMNPEEHSKNLKNASSVIKTLLNKGVVPFVLGGDHGTTIPVLRAYKDYGPLFLVHVDAHIDFRNERDGFKYGFSSPMRRASEMPWIKGIVHIGLRGSGSARKQEVDLARKYGSIIVSAEELHRIGVERIIEMIPQAEGYYFSIDADGFDPSLSPGVFYPSPGGLTYYQITGLIKGIAKKGRISGFDFVEYVPGLDVRNLTAIFAGRLILSFIGAMAYSGQIGKEAI